MYSVVEIGGSQYRVGAGDLLDVEKLNFEAGSTVNLDKVLFVGGPTPIIGKPTVPGAVVTVKVVKHDRDRKLIIFKRLAGRWRRKNGHRQHYTCLLVTEITDGKGAKATINKESKEAKKYLA